MEAAVKRGQGVSASGAALESLQIECMGPGSVAMIMFVFPTVYNRQYLSTRLLTTRTINTI